MIAKCGCQNCRSSIEFHAADFMEQSRTSTQVIGQYVRCPHCGFATPLTMSLARWSKMSSTETIQASPAIFIVLALVIALIPAGIVMALMRSGVSLRQIVTGGAGVPGQVALGIAGFLVIIQAIMWLIFPWLVCWRLSKIRAELRRIQQNFHANEALKS